MKTSRLVSEFLSVPWNLEGPMYNRLSELLHKHITGTKVDANEVHNGLFDDEPELSDEDIADREAKHDHVENNIAIIAVRGVLARHSDQVNGECQAQGRSYQQIIEQLTAARDAGVAAMIVRLETPGGMANGCQEVFDMIHSISAGGIPVHAFIDGYCFSAGAYIASACDTITLSSKAANYGSIGTIMSTYDNSEAWASEGFKAVVIRSGEFKALGQSGEVIDDATKADMQRTCDAYAGSFYDAVIMGRGLSDEQAAVVCNGRTWQASEAIQLGLADHIANWAHFINEITATYGDSETNQPLEETPMSLFKNNKTDTDNNDDKKKVEALAGISKADFTALALAFPNAIEKIDALDGEGKTSDEIHMELLTAENNALKAAVKEQTDNVVEQSEETSAEAAAELAKAQKENETLQAQVEKSKKWTAQINENEDPGSDDATLGDPMSETSLKASWEAMSPDRQAHFGTFESFVFCKREKIDCEA